MKIFNFFRDILTRIRLSMKLILRDKITVAVFIISCACFFYLCATLNFSAQTQSRIPIGVVNQDIDEDTGKPSELSDELLQRVIQSDSFRVTYGDLEELKKSLSEGEINCIFVINPGYEKSIRKGNAKHLISVLKTEGDQTAILLSDVFAGQMIDQISLYKSILKYNKLDFTDAQQLSEEEYKAFVAKELEDSEFVFNFDVTLKDAQKKSNVSYERLDNSALYRQIVAGIFAMLLSFVVLFSYTYVCMEKEQGMLRRKKLTLMNRAAETIGTLISVLMISCLLCLIFVSCICFYAKIKEAFLPLLGLSFTYAVIMSVIFMLLVRVTKGVLSYQMIGAIVILLLGMLGFCSMVDGILFKDFLNIVKNTPNGWFIGKFVDIIVNMY